MATRLYNDPAFRAVLEALIADLQDKLPVEFANRMRGADNVPGLIGILFDLAAAVPQHASYIFHLLAQLLEAKGGNYKALGEFVHMIPATADTLRLVTGKTEESARNDLVAAWKTYRSNPSRGLSRIIGDLMSTTPAAAAASTAPLPKDMESKAQKLLAEKFSHDQCAAVLGLFRIFRIEGAPGSDIVAELEGDARSGKDGLIDTVKHNANHILPMLAGDDFGDAMTAYKAMRALEKDGCVSSADRKEWREQAAAFVRHLIPVIEFILIGHAERHPGSTTADAALDLLDRLNFMAGLQPSSAFEKARALKTTVSYGLRGMGFFTGALLFYILIAVMIARVAPEALSTFALASTWVGLGGCALLLVVLAFVSGTLQLATGAILMLFVSTGLTAAWILTGIFSPVEGWWTDAWFALLAVTLFDIVVVSIAQSGVHGLAAIPGVLSIFIKDNAQLKAVTDAIQKWKGLTQFSVTIAMAGTLLMVPVMLANMGGVSMEWRAGGLLLITVSALIVAQLRRAANQGDNKALKAIFDAWDELKAKMAIKNAIYLSAGVVAVFILTWIFGQESIIAVRDGVRDTVVQSVSVTGTATRGALDDAEAKVNNTGAPATKSGSTNSANEAQRRKDLKALDRVYDGDYCRTHTGYPCK